jgi:hypothetical protein
MESLTTNTVNPANLVLDLTIDDIPQQLLEQIKKNCIREYLLSTGRGRKPKSESYKKRIKVEQNRKNVLKRNAKLGIIGFRKNGRKPKDNPNQVVVIPLEDIPPIKYKI